jgi:capsular exopolysaccharide synthesis family protein
MSEEEPGHAGYGTRVHAQDLDEPELKHYIGILRRRVWVIVIITVIAVTIGAVYAFKATPVYEAVAKVLLEKQSPRVTNFEEVVQVRAGDRDYHKTQKEMMESRTVLDKALFEPGISDLPEVSGESTAAPSLLSEIKRTAAAAIGAEPSTPLEPWERLRKHIEVEQLRDTDLLLVRARSHNPLRAAKMAGAVARAFEKYHIERKLSTSGEAFRYLKEQKEKQETELLDAEEELQQFREEAKIVSLDVNDKENPVLARLIRLGEQLTEVQLQRIELEAQSKVVEAALATGTEALEGTNKHLFNIAAVRADETIAQGRAELIEAEKELSALSDTYGPEHPQLVAAEARVSLLRAKLEEALVQLVRSLTAQLEMLTKQENELRQEYELQNAQALQLAKQSLVFSRLQSEADRKRKLFDMLVERMRQVDVSGDFARTNVEVVEEPDVPTQPVTPKKAQAVALALAIGLLLGIGLAFFFEHMDDTVKTPADLEDRIGVAVLGFVPAIDAEHVAGNGFSHPGAICVIEPNSSATEAYRNIRTNLFFSAPAEERKVLMVTSSGPGDGKTTTATNLALVIAQSGKRVLLADADFRRPMVHRVFSQKPGTGLSTLLVREGNLKDTIRAVKYDGQTIENLDLLVAGHNPPNPAELLGSKGMQSFLEEARKLYDVIILDTPPVLFVADASIVSTISDGVILVVKAAANSRTLARRAREHLDGVHARILGGILNNVRTASLGYYYSDYYYYGYSQYSSDYSSSYYAREDEA